MNTCKIGSRRGFIPLFLALALTLLLFPTTASAKDMVDVTQEVTLRVGETVTLTNPASAKGMAISAYSWRLEGGDVVSEDNTANSATASVTALQPGRAIVIGYLDGCYAQTKQISSNYDDETRTWDKFHYTTYSENYTYTYRFHITVLNPDGSEPSGATFAELTAQMEAEDEAAADEIANTGFGICGANVRWVFDHGTLIISGTGAMKDYGEYEMQGWYGYDIKRVIIRDGVTRIGTYAFSSGAKGNRFTTIESVSIAGSVKEIGNNAFLGCTSLKTLSFSEGLTDIGANAFNGCSALETLLLPNTVKTIGLGGFSSCTDLKYVYLPEGLTVIDTGGFGNCVSLTSAVIPSTVTSLGGGAFEYCDELREVAVLGRITDIYDWTFAFCPSLEILYLPDSVKEVETFAFDVTETVEIDIYFEGTQSQWKRAAYDDLFRRWHLPNGVSVHYGSDLPDPPARVTLEAPADLDEQAQSAVGSVELPQTSAQTKPEVTQAPHSPVTVDPEYTSFCWVRLDGKTKALRAFSLTDEKGNATNYVRLREVAQLLSGTKAQFEVGWTATEGIVLTKGCAYTVTGTEDAEPPTDRTAVLNTQTVNISGTAVVLESLTITDNQTGDGYTYVKLRDLGQALNFNVCWNIPLSIIDIESTAPYSG